MPEGRSGEVIDLLQPAKKCVEGENVTSHLSCTVHCFGAMTMLVLIDHAP